MRFLSPDLTSFVGPAQGEQASRVDTGRALGQEAVNDGIDRRVATDHQGDERDRGEGETWGRAQNARAGRQILPRPLDPSERPDAPRVFSRQGDVAERMAARPLGVKPCRAVTLELRPPQRSMCVHFIAQLRLVAGPSEQIAKASEQSSHQRMMGM